MTFADLNLNKSLLNALADLGLEEPTAIQRKVFSPIMAGQDVVGLAQTGTGKTFAYLLPVLRLWKFTKSPFPQIMIVVPTRELAMQVAEEVTKLTTYQNLVVLPVYGGTNMKIQKVDVAAGVDVMVGTPGRLVDLMADGVLRTKLIKRLVIDEVDEMLNLGFRTQLRAIIDFLPKKRQNLMFSATMLDEVLELINEFTDHFEVIAAAPSGAPLENIEQYAYAVPNFNTKANLLELLLKEHPEMSKVLVFAGTKKLADALYERLAPAFDEESMGIIHSSKSQNNRFATVEKFQDGTYRFIIATDIIARGLDVSSVTHVINFDLPDTAEKYVHRIGRTGRAEERGVAVSFIREEEDKEYRAAIEELTGLPIPIRPNPEGLEVSDELISLEVEVEHIPFTDPNAKRFEPTGPAFHEKKAKNQKVNRKIRRAEAMKLKYKKPKTRGQKKKGKK